MSHHGNKIGDEEVYNDILSKIISSKKKCELVVAAAGSGKTYILINTLIERLKNKQIDLKKEKIVVFTFTNNAADELSFRLSSALTSDQDRSTLENIFIGTIHGWCNEILSDYGTLSNTKIIDEKERDQFVQRVYPILGIDILYQGLNKYDKIEKFLKDLEIFYNEALDISDPSIPDNVRKTIEAYLIFLKSQRLMDFGFIIREATSILNNQQYKDSFHIYIDEYQDVNPAQVKLLKAMLGTNINSHLFAVGDPRQAIYQWRGGDIQRILSFQEDFDNTEVHELNINRRSRTGIISFGNIIANNMNFNNTISIMDMKVSQNRKDDKISVIEDIGSYPQEEHIVKLIKNLIKEGVEPNHIAVLLRSVVHHGQPLMDVFEQQSIPFYSPNRNAGTQFIGEFMGSIFELIELVHNPPNLGNYEEEEELNQKIDECLLKMSKYCKNKSKNEVHIAIIEWYKKLNKQTKYNNKVYRNESYNLRKQFFEFCQKIDFTIKPAQTDLQQGFSAITQIMKSIEESYRRRLIDGYNIRPSPYDVFSHNLKWQLDRQKEEWAKTGMPVSSKKSVIISTVHAAKGLEWPVVILPYVWKKRFPLKPSSHETSFNDKVAERYGTSIEDEKRLWYVAVTRARDRLYIFGGTDSKHQISGFTFLESFKNDDQRILTESVKEINHEKLSLIQPFSKPSYIKIGVSDLLLLLECQYHFYLRKVSNVEVPVGEELGAGNIIHKVIHRLSKGEDKSKLDVILDEEVYLPLAEYSHEQHTKKSIKEKIDFLIQSGILQKIDKSEYKFEIPLENVIVTGIIDATRKLPDDSVEIIDWKYSIHEELFPRYEKQLKFYAYVLEKLGMDVTRALLYDLNASSKIDNLKNINIDISLASIKQVITKANKSIMNLSNNDPITEPHPICCAICDVAFICPDRLITKIKRF